MTDEDFENVQNNWNRATRLVDLPMQAVDMRNAATAYIMALEERVKTLKSQKDSLRDERSNLIVQLTDMEAEDEFLLDDRETSRSKRESIKQADQSQDDEIYRTKARLFRVQMDFLAAEMLRALDRFEGIEDRS